MFPMESPTEYMAEFPLGSGITALAFAHKEPLLVVKHEKYRVSVFEISGNSFVPREQYDEPGSASSMVAFSPTDDTLYVQGAGGIQRRDVRAMKILDPTIRFSEPLLAFALTSRPEAVVVVTSGGKLIQRVVPNLNLEHEAVVVPGPVASSRINRDTRRTSNE